MRSKGFSLLEAMVTLVVIALVATLLMQSLTHVLGMRERVLRHERDARVEALHERWFRDSVTAAAADRPGASPSFRGDATSMAFFSLDALRAQSAAAVGWRLVENTGGVRLEYVEAGATWPLLVESIEAGAFAYLDSAGQWHDTWPVAEHPGEVLPRAVRLVLRSVDGEIMWWAHVGPEKGLPPALANPLESASGGL